MVETQQAQKKIMTPCRSQCVVDWELQYCQGCLRSLEEIAAWRDLDHDDRLLIIKELEFRNEEYFRRQCGIS